MPHAILPPNLGILKPTEYVIIETKDGEETHTAIITEFRVEVDTHVVVFTATQVVYEGIDGNEPKLLTRYIQCGLHPSAMFDPLERVISGDKLRVSVRVMYDRLKSA